MGEVKELNIKNRTYYYFNDIFDIKDFHSNLLKIDKKQYKDIDIYYIGYITAKKIGDCENISSVYPLYLMIHSAAGYFREKYGEKYLVLDSTEKYDEVFSGIKKEIETINGGKKLIYEENYARIGVNTDDDVPLFKPLQFPTLTIIIRCVFQEDTIAIVHVKKSTYRIYFLYMSKREAKKLMTNSNLIDKKGVL